MRSSAKTRDEPTLSRGRQWAQAFVLVVALATFGALVANLFAQREAQEAETRLRTYAALMDLQDFMEEPTRAMAWGQAILEAERYRGLEIQRADGSTRLRVRSVPSNKAFGRTLEALGLLRIDRLSVPLRGSGARGQVLVAWRPNRGIYLVFLALLVSGLLGVVGSVLWTVAQQGRQISHMRLDLERHERQTVEARLREKEHELRETRRMEGLGRLASGVAHDFNNLLTVIVSSAELIRPQLTRERDLRRMDALLAAVDNGCTLTRQLLAFGRRQPMSPRPVELNGIARDMSGMLERLVGDDYDLVVACDEGIGPIRADPGQIEQVLLNLVINARDAMPRGGPIVVRTRLEEGGPLDGYVALEVSDTGVGMDEETQSRIFEPFYTTKGDQGTGLGLATVHGIVKQNDGDIRVASAPGEGTTFTVLLPCTFEEKTLRISRGVAQAPAERSSETGRILLVQDRQDLLGVTAGALRYFGFEVFEARTGQEALTLAGQADHHFELVITDLQSAGGLGGAELAVALRAEEPSLRVLFITGLAGPPLRVQGTAVLQKPFGPTRLLEVVRGLLGEARADRQGTSATGDTHH